MNIFNSVSFLKEYRLLALICVSFYGYGQNSESQVSRLQRSIYIYNIAQQVKWPENIGDTFNIGVLGPDRVVIDFKAMAQKRQIKSRPVSVINFLSVKEIKNVNILYVNRKYNYQMPYILESVKDKGIVVISEDYTFNSAMINIVRVQNSFRHQINDELLKNERFEIAPTLRSFAIKTSDKWKGLFKEAQDSLRITQQQLKLKDSLIVVQNSELINKSELLDTIQELLKEKDSSIQDFFTEAEVQKKTIEEKRIIAQTLETRIKEQVTQLSEQDAIIRYKTNEIKIRQDSINEQRKSITAQEQELVKQSFELTIRENLNWLLAVIAILLFTAGFIAFKNYKAKDLLSKKLTLQNATITQQAEDLKQKNADLEQFAYIASHDLQEPLNTISSFIGLIKNDYQEQFDDLGKQSLLFIEEASSRMKNLIRVLLEYSRIGRAREFKLVDCDQLMQELQKDITSLVDRKKAIINVNELPIVLGSEVELRLLFQNLITNALKFCPKDRSPVLNINAIKTDSLKNPKNQVWQFSFIDNGIGIREDHQERIFSIFQRLHSKEEYEGTGIGLAHCKKIVAIHQGDIWLESEVGKGSTFFFTIPVQE